MVSFPNIKINLGLNVLRRRNDGYHDIQTVMFPVPFCDILEVLPDDRNGLKFSFSGLDVPGDQKDNLVVKAWGLFAERTGVPGAKIHLHKVVPAGSGLGGASSDGAFTLLMLNEVFKAPLRQVELLEMASRLGSDCPFFVINRPACATGRGEALSEVSPDLSGKSIVLVMPGFHVSTSWAYSAIHPRETEITPAEVVKKDISEWKGLLFNDFEGPVFEAYPVIRAIRDRLYELGALYASMSGSGSAVYGIFDMNQEEVLKDFMGYKVWKSSVI